jgi:hypothetical protein
LGVREKTVEKQREQIEIQREKTTTCIGPRDKEKPMTFEGKIFFFWPDMHAVVSPTCPCFLGHNQCW